MKYLFKLILEFFLRFRAILAIGVVMGVLFFLSARFIFPIFLSPPAEKIGITGKYRTSDLPSFVLQDIGQGLTSLDESGATVPALAESWSSPDKGKTWTFHLSKDKKWQDGSKVTSDTVKYNFEDVDIKANDPYTLTFTLKNAFSPFPVVVSRPVFKKGLLGTGSYKVTNLSLVGGYVEKLTIEDKDRKRKIYKFYPTEERTKLAFKLGEVDKLVDLIDPEPFETWKNTKLESTENLERFVAVFFNTQEGILADKSLRQALFYAIDKAHLDGERAYTPVSPNSWAYNPQVKAYDYDPQRAREIIKDLPKETKQDLSVVLSTPASLLKTAEKIQKNWQDVGVKTTIQVVPAKPDNYQAFLIIHDIPSDPDQYSMWHSTQEATNISKYKSPRIDKLLEDGRTELNQETRKKIYLDFQRFLLEDAPAAFLYHPISYEITRK